MRLRLAGLLLLGLSLAAPGAAGLPDDRLSDTGERFRTPVLGTEFRVLRDPATGEKALERADGRRFASVEAAVLDEEAGLSALRRAVHPGLLAAVEDASRAGETLRVFLLLADQPLHAASREARARVEPGLRVRLARMRAILGGIAGSRREDPGRELQVGDRFEEERGLLGDAGREELRRLRDEVQSLSRGLRPEALSAARGATEESQAPVVEAVESVPGARVLGRYRVLNAVATELPAGSVAGLLRALPQVVRVLPLRTRSAFLNTSVATIGASSWTGAGYDGSSTTKVAVLDTGVDTAHSDFTRADSSAVVTAQQVFLSAATSDSTFWDDASSTDDLGEHGTHVAGIVAGANSAYRGVAPGASVLNGKCGYRFRYYYPGYGWIVGASLQDPDILAAGDWAADNGADSANCSFGGADTTDGSSALTLFFDALADDLGVSVAVAAGNSGPGSGTIGVPADGFNVVTVGSLDDAGTATHSDNSISSFSSRGPLSDGRRKPDLCAPGSQITSANPAWEGSAPDFVAWDGTSMATPHVAGALALLEDYAAAWRPESMRALLMVNARNTSPYPASPGNAWGTGAMDLAAAFTNRASVVEGTLSTSSPAFAFLRSGTLASGKRAILCWNRAVVSNGASTPTTYRAPVDLDLYVYEEADDSSRGSSTSALNTAEVVTLSSASSFPVLKVRRAGPFPGGQSTVDWSVATTAASSLTPCAPPILECSFTAIPGTIGLDQPFEVTVSVTNTGELPADNPTVSLDLPPGYSLVSGANPATVVTIPATGLSRTATWTVTAAGTGSGPRTFSVSATTSSFGEVFTSDAEEFVQDLDAVAPDGVLTVAGGAAAVNTTAVTLGIFGVDDTSGVSSMRLRNQGGNWGPWQPFAETLPWTLPGPDGVRTVEAQLRDSAGNQSTVLADSVVLDTRPPAGSFILAGGAEYLMPWEPLTASTASYDDAAGAGVTDARVRWAAGSWTGWMSPPGPTLDLDRPGLEGNLVADGQFRDGAGNLSATYSDGLYLVEAAPPGLTEAKSFAGTLDAGGDFDAFTVDLAAGDLLTVKVRAKPATRGADFRADVDLFAPDGTKAVSGRWPAALAKPGILKFPAPATGTHWVVLRPGGAARAEGGTYALTIKVSPPKENRRRRGATEPAGDPPVASAPFDAVESFTLRGTVRGAALGEIELLAPDGGTVPVPSVVSSGGTKRKILPLVLAGGTGTYTLRVPSTAFVVYDLTLKPPKRVKMEETP